MHLLSAARRKIEDGRVCARFGDGAWSRLKLFCSPALAAIASRVGLPLVISARVRLGNETCRVYLTDTSDCAVFQEVFAGREYELAVPFEPRNIIDLGSNVGMTVAFWKLTYPQARVIAVEPDPTTFAKLTRTAAQFNDVTCLCYAICDHDGEASFYSDSTSSFSSSLLRRGQSGREVRVTTRTLESLLSECGLQKADVLKFDIEGAEDKLFLGPVQPQSFRAVVGEVHPDLMSVAPDTFLQRFSHTQYARRQLAGSRFFISALVA